MSVATYVWPGLPQLSFEGAWLGLALAFGFGLLVNFLLVASLVWIELIKPPVLWLSWLAVGVIWAGSGLFVAWTGGLPIRRQRLRHATTCFAGLWWNTAKGSWFEAESMFGQLVVQDNRDADSRLMLASLLRHTRHPLEARRQLDEWSGWKKPEKWRIEIERERSC